MISRLRIADNSALLKSACINLKLIMNTSITNHPMEGGGFFPRKALGTVKFGQIVWVPRRLWLGNKTAEEKVLCGGNLVSHCFWLWHEFAIELDHSIEDRKIISKSLSVAPTWWKIISKRDIFCPKLSLWLSWWDTVLNKLPICLKKEILITFLWLRSIISLSLSILWSRRSSSWNSMNLLPTIVWRWHSSSENTLKQQD